MTVKDLSLVVEKMKTDAAEKDVTIKALEEKVTSLQKWVEDMYSHVTKKNQDSDQQHFNNVKVLENKLNVIENKMVASKDKSEPNEVERTESLICKKCDIGVDNKKDLKKQILAVHPVEFSCNVCGEVYATSVAFEFHLKNHEEVNKFKCDICDQSFYMKWRLRKHELQHQMTIVKYCHYFNNMKKCDYLEIGCMFKHDEAPICKSGKFCKRRLCQFKHILTCRTCEFKSSSSQELLRHQTQVHGVSESEDPKQDNNSTNVVYACDMCSFDAKSEDEFAIHKTNNHETIRQQNSCDTSDDDDNDEEYVDEDAPYDCDHCESNNVQPAYRANDFNDLIRHIHNDHGPKSVFGQRSC